MSEALHSAAEPSIFRALADYASGLKFEELPSSVVQRVNLCVMDLIASTYAALGGRTAEALRDYAIAVNPSPQATLWGSELRVGAIEAATANGATAYEAEFDDGNSLGGHWGSSGIPAILALAERDEISAQDVIVAIVAAYEVANRVSQPFSQGLLARGVHYPGGMGGVAATVGAGRALRLNGELLAAALGFTALLPVAPYFPSYEGADVKNLYSGWPNHCGLHFAMLAKAGYRGSTRLLEGRDGLAKVLGWQGTIDQLKERVLGELGTNCAILATYFKPYPCCRWLHSPVQALLQLLNDRLLTGSEIIGIEVEAPAFVGRMYFDVGPFVSATQARYSVPYALAAALCHGRLGQREYEAPVLDEAEVQALANRTTFVTAPDLDEAFPTSFSSRIRVTTVDGQVHAGRSALPWSAESPPTFTQLAAKFRAIMAPLCGDAVTNEWLNYFEEGLQADATLQRFYDLLRRSVV